MGKTVMGVFQDQEQAERARSELVDSGFAGDDIYVTSRETLATTGAMGVVRRGEQDEGFGDSVGHLVRSLFGLESNNNYAETYTEAVRRGNFLVSVRTDSAEQETRAEAVLERCGAVNADELAAQLRGGATGAGSTPLSAAEFDRQGRVGGGNPEG